ncbi:restriction endonuclease subunit S [Thiococcus pfennigii]|uniref:restriction endonuclease subunit S n=1 Tax=Thiococcus pfennigii TaxID=1057 RepID=UPI001904FFE1|nr:restriction endonuclease subunit S [Thiococcus pfennigii]MBK1731459.1 restriction endonuclease subunit S [Thiococcus pfennigii]
MNLGELAEVQMGYPFRSRVEHDPQGDVAVIQMRDIDDANRLHAEEAIRVALPKGKSHHLLRPGDLLFRSRGGRNGAAHVQEGIEAAVLAAPMLLIRPHSVLPAYLCWYINAPVTQARLAALAEGTSVRMISAEALRALEVPLPPPAMQQRIVQIAALAEQEQALVARIASLRQRLTSHRLMQLAHPSPVHLSLEKAAR